MRDNLKVIGVCAALAMLSACGQDAPVEAPAAAGKPAQAAALAPGVALKEDAARKPVEANSDKAKCNIEMIGGKSADGTAPEVAKSANVRIEGWYIDTASHGVGDKLQFVVHNSDQSKFWVADIPARGDRGDVDQAQGGNGAYAKAGVSFDVDMSQLPSGWYGVNLDGSAGACALGRGFKLD